jgi:hypothetical protein
MQAVEELSSIMFNVKLIYILLTCWSRQHSKIIARILLVKLTCYKTDFLF